VPSLDCAGGRFDASTGLCWQDPSVCCYDWQEAIDYCEGLDLAGHTDWTLPSRQDFIDLLGGCDSGVLGGSSGYCNSCAESETCGELFGSDGEWCWSSSPYDSYRAWRVGFGYGRVSYDVVSRGRDVRCVRPGP